MARLGILLVIVAFSLMATSAVGGPAGKAKVIIAFQAQPGAGEEALVRDLGGSIKYTYHLVPAIAASLPEGAIADLLARPGVVRVEPDIKVHAVDAELDNSWGVKRIGAGTVHDGGNKGTGIKVAVLDTGIDTDHADLAANYDPGCSYDFVNGDSLPEDGHGHGTHVSGTIAAVDNDVGVVGVASEATICAYKVLNDSGSGSYSDVIAALERALQDGVQVTNNSYGSSGDPGETVKAAFDNAYAAGIIHAGAAGNSGNPPGRGENCIYPALWESVIAVAATDKDDRRASFSSTCPELELAAPGVDVNSTWIGGGYHEGSGTSMATPHVAGTAALVIRSGISNNDEVRLRLQQTADDLGKAGRDSQYGFGLVDAAEAAAPAAPDTTGAAVTGVDPAAGATGVAVATNVTVSFCEPVDPTTVTGGTFIVNDGSVNIAGTITVAGDGLSATFDPDSDLANETTYTVTVTSGVTDTSGNALDQDGDPTNGNQDFTSRFTTAAAGAAGTVHVGDLDGESVKLERSKWKALVTITVHDAGEGLVAYATVSGTWTQNGTVVGNYACVTGGSGQCTIDSGQLPGKSPKATFTVDSVTHSDYTYDAAANHDPDGDSDGTSITVSK
jgi:subtilisin family serine protease